MSCARQTIPTTLTPVQTEPFKLIFLEVVNDTNGAISFSAYDSTGLCVIPSQSIDGGRILTYESRYGTPTNGLLWKASGPGLVGWFRGDSQ